MDNPYQSPTASEPKPRWSVPLRWHYLVPLTSFLGTVVLFTAVMHVNADRSQSRQPIITYVGPLASWMPHLVYLGLGLSLLAFILSVLLLHCDREQVPQSSASSSAGLAMGMAMFNAIGTFLVYAAILED